MNSTVLVNIARFILLIFAQVVIFDNMMLFGYFMTFPYILFIMLFPVNGNRNVLLLTSFFLGIILDMFHNMSGFHAASCVILAYVRPAIFKFSFGLSYEYQTVRLDDVLTPERFSFILISVIIHHFTLFLLEVFRFVYFWDVLLRTLGSTIYTIVVCIILIYMFKPSRR